MKNSSDVLIIGAGIAGLTAARALVDAGADVILVEKGRGVGGRMASRRFSGATFDHGAQFITVRTPEFEAVVREWLDAGVAELWSHGFADGLTGDGSLLTAAADGGRTPHLPARDGHPRYRGVPAMTGIPKHVARRLDARLGVRASSIRRLDDTWEVEADAGRHYRGSSVIVTAPVPQSLALLDAGGTKIDRAARSELDRIEYAKCVALLARYETSVELPEPGAIRRVNDHVQWIADNGAKGVSESGPAITIHCGEKLSEELYDEPDEDITQTVLRAIARLVPEPPSAAQVKRWRYSRPRSPLDVGCWTDGLPDGLVLAGDAFCGARVEGAVRSGMAAADRISNR